MRLLITGVLLIAIVTADDQIHAAEPLRVGDIVVSVALPPIGGGQPYSDVRVYSRDGTLKLTIVTSTSTVYRGTLFQNGILLVGTNETILRFTADGYVLPPLNSEYYAGYANYFSPAFDGGVVVNNGHGDMFRLNQDGSLRALANLASFGAPGHGADLGPDQCSVFYSNNRLAVWNTCDGSSPRYFGSADNFVGGFDLRLLPTGEFLVARGNNVERLDAQGNLIMSYPFSGRTVALDVDGQSFWAQDIYELHRVNIQTGEILQTISVDQPLMFVSVVGEPRAASSAEIPTVSPRALLILAVVLALSAVKLTF